MTPWTRNGIRRSHGGGKRTGHCGWPGPDAQGGARPESRGHRRPPPPSRADGQLACRLPRHCPTARGMAGTGCRHRLRTVGGARLPRRTDGRARRAPGPHGRAGLIRVSRRLPGDRRCGPFRAVSRAGGGAGGPRCGRARRGRPGVRDRRRDAHRARARRRTPARRQPAHGRDTHRRPALARRHGSPGRSSIGATLRHLARPVPAAPPVPLGPAPRAGRDRAVVARRVRGRRSGPGVPHAPAADRAPSAPTTPPGRRGSS